tara:strand:+ start:365 stop:562 length:198 start_codon:yes stop_codon:yes gene_type:complete
MEELTREQKILFIIDYRLSSEFIEENTNNFIAQEYNKMSDEDLDIEYKFYINSYQDKVINYIQGE